MLKSNKSSLAVLMAMALAGGMGFEKKDPDHSVRDSNRMPLNDEEIQVLASLYGKDKKKYIKLLREKYRVHA